MMSSIGSLKEVVKQLVDTFNNPEIREPSYFDFYDDSLTIHGFAPNLPSNIVFEDLIVEENKVAGRYYLTGTHKGEFMGLQPSNKQFKVNGMTVWYFQGAKCTERWNLVDMMSLMEQLRT
jgi:predicted ester cyclase